MSNYWMSLFNQAATNARADALADKIHASLAPLLVEALINGEVSENLDEIFKEHPKVCTEVLKCVTAMQFAVPSRVLLQLLPFSDSLAFLTSVCDLPAKERDWAVVEAFERMASDRNAEGLLRLLSKLDGAELRQCALAVLPHLPKDTNLADIGKKLMRLVVIPMDGCTPIEDLIDREHLLNEVLRIASAVFALANLPEDLMEDLRDMDTLLMLADLGRCFRLESSVRKNRLQQLVMIRPIGSRFRIARVFN